MNNYNFTELLSPLRFEQLTRDLLRDQYGDFENFAEGKDGGIDFRYYESNEKILAVQCKRYKDVKSLISNLKKEATKNIGNKFTDYLLVVSLDVTDRNKEEIIKNYNGRIRNPYQIITRTDLNSLLGLPQNQYVEFKYPELWMNSVNIHQKIFHLGFLKHSEFIKDRLKDSLKNFVPYKEYNQVLEHFETSNTAIITGNPGIGKTTLSHAIISNYIYFQDFQLIDLSSRKIQEAESYINSNTPTIFFIDDFLGKIKLEKGNDFAQLLLYFIEKIEKQENKKLIITSREYILKKANKELFPIQEINQTISKYVIEISSFTRRIRTEILYKHLKNSELSPNYINDFLQNNFNQIIDHRNYNPRIIEHLTNTKLLKDISSEQYFDYFIENLENPTKVWENVYNNLPNDLYKIILLIRFLISEPLPVKNLEKAITNLIEKSDKFRQYSYDDFEYIIRELEGTFFSFSTGYDELVDEEYTLIEFHNPSINDFIDSFIWQKTNWLNIIITHAIYFEQLFNWELLEIISENSLLMNSFRNKILKDFHSLSNSGFGYFEYEDEHDEGSFLCWIPERYNYYLAELVKAIDIENEIEIAEFLKREIFRYSFDGTEEIVEKIAFSQVAIELLKIGLITSESAITHYISSGCREIKELVFLEYMTRACNKDSLALIMTNKELIREADELFLDEIKTLKEKDFMDILDFFDDFTQIKRILPLTKTTKKLKKVNSDKLLEEAYKRFGEPDLVKQKIDKTEEKRNYFDITDKAIIDLLRNISNQ